jgi:3-isopropylmalate/(R)-2-methylmalate dehydratase small subunit
MMRPDGRAWCLGDDVDTDAITPAQYVVKNDPTVWAKHALEHVRPDFAAGVRAGDFLVAGHTFGSGSSREHSAIALRETRLAAVIAESFARNFYRNAFNNGLLALEVPGVLSLISDGDQLHLDLKNMAIINRTRDVQIPHTAVPPFLLDMHRSGGLVPWLLSTGGEWDISSQPSPQGAHDDRANAMTGRQA